MEMNFKATQAQRTDREERTYTVPEIAGILKIKIRSAYALCSRNPPFQVIHIGRSVRVKKDSFDRWFEGCGSD